MNAIDIALKMETDAVDFYKKASEKTSHPVGKKMFLSIMEDEMRHIDMLMALLKEMEISSENVDPMSRVKSVFEEMKEKMLGNIKASTSEIQAFQTAMKMEREGFEFYKKQAVSGPDAKSRALFERLMHEEEKHYQIFSNTLSFLSDTGNWFMWEEHGIVDGGTPTA